MRDVDAPGGRWRRGVNLPGTLTILALIVFWQVAAVAKGSPSLPGVLAVLAALVANLSDLMAELGRTLLRAATGFSITLLTMVPLGILLGRVRLLGDLVEPVIELLRPLPPIAIVPVSMIFLGIGDTAKIAVVIYGAAFPILVNTIDAVRGLEPMLSHVARSLRLSRAERMSLIDLPAALPQIVTGIRISIANALLLAIVAEMLLSTDGLGAFLMRAQESFQIAKVLASLVLISIVALLINVLTRAVERRALSWHELRSAVR